MFKDEYNAMYVEDHEEERKQPCPPELARRKTLEYDGFECEVFYNYVPPYSYGVIPMNCWWGYVSMKGYNWKCPLNETVKTLEEACQIIKPMFEMVVKRLKRKLEATNA